MSTVMTETALIHRFQKGDARAFNTIYNRYFYSLRYFSLRLICQKQEAEEITVETFLKLYRLCANFENIANIRAFLYVTARNACYDYLSWMHRQPAEPSLMTAGPDGEYRYPGGSGLAEDQILRALFEAIESLPPEHYQVFKLSYVRGQKTGDIADMLQTNAQAVKVVKRRAIQLLRIALFEKNLPEAALGYLSMVKTGDLTPIKKVVASIYDDAVN